MRRAQPGTLAHLRRLLAVPDEQPAQLCAEKRLALAKMMHPRLGGAGAAAQTIACESGLRT